MDIASLLLTFAVVLASLTVHEWAHAWTADRLGDPTARMLGRVSFNPIVHIDPVGTILLPLIGMLSAGVIFGWAKPVPVNLNRLRHPKRDFMIIAAAGPASNIVIAMVAAAVFHGLGGWGAVSEMRPAGVLVTAVSINVLLAVFNMLPIPPLDGGNVLAGLLPDSYAGLIHTLRQYGFLILLALMLSGVLRNVVAPIAEFLTRLLL